MDVTLITPEMYQSLSLQQMEKKRKEEKDEGVEGGIIWQRISGRTRTQKPSLLCRPVTV